MATFIQNRAVPQTWRGACKNLKGWPLGVNIFLRELHGIWEKAKPKPSPIAVTTAQKIGLNPEDAECYESQLVRLNLEYCKKRRSSECQLKDKCPDKVVTKGTYRIQH
ncbi:MAG: hypothetical protein ABSD42_13235 [Candidatus Bathyarchaeia archaeon]